ncbi:MAG: PhzF family phenazine biosynthesis protein [Bdellovibrionales bacterium]|nr:PhzF family phenazine biosynthesis protein [Bdellovibrionales bacterium]
MKFWQVDSFTNQPFCGNPAAVLFLTEDLSDETKQNIALEMSVSETAFVLQQGDSLSLRWFTPNAEVDLCGHATLAAAHVLWSEGLFTDNHLTFQSKSGPLHVSRTPSGYTLDFPLQSPTETPKQRELLGEILGTPPLYVGSNSHDCVAVVESEERLRSLTPNFELIKELPERGLLVTARSANPAYDYIYRGFFPKLDIPEDPVTGSANTLLAPYWANKLGKTSLKAYQASARGGELSVEVSGERVLISGSAVTTLRGEILCENSTLYPQHLT